MPTVCNYSKSGPWTDPVTGVEFSARRHVSGRDIAAVDVPDAAPYEGRKADHVVVLTDEQAAAQFPEGE